LRQQGFIFRLARYRVHLLAIAVAMLVMPLAAHATEVRAIGVAALSDGAVAVVIDATGAAAVSATALTGPNRLILDVPGVPYRAEALEGSGRGFVSAFRIGDDGARDGSGTRIVLDLDQPALADSIEMVPGASGVRMIVRLVKADAKEFAAAASETRMGDVVSTGSTGSSEAGGTMDLAANVAEDDKIVVVIDPGHGGNDPGAVVGSDIQEKNVTLDFAQALKIELEKSPRLRVVLTRQDDHFVALGDRVKLAQENKAALMVSIHADTLNDEPGVRGSTIYTLADKASDVRSARLADKENSVDALGGASESIEDADLSDILFDLTRRETRAFSSSLAHGLIGRLKDAVKINKNPLRFARFRVLMAPDVPSVLLELGYLSSEDDAKLVTSSEWRNQTASATALAIRDFVEARFSAALTPIVDPASATEALQDGSADPLPGQGEPVTAND
jgi:N-acetylmuramoyl-L-alanine amidase